MKDGKSSKCLFCGKEKTWKSYMLIQVGDNKPIGFTICPEDRKHTVQEVYERVAELNAKKVLLDVQEETKKVEQ